MGSSLQQYLLLGGYPHSPQADRRAAWGRYSSNTYSLVGTHTHLRQIAALLGSSLQQYLLLGGYPHPPQADRRAAWGRYSSNIYSLMWTHPLIPSYTINTRLAWNLGSDNFGTRKCISKKFFRLCNVGRFIFIENFIERNCCIFQDLQGKNGR